MLTNLIVQPAYVPPFLRWAGGKTWLVRNLNNYLPKTISNYYEPFVGGGAVFFNISGYKKAYLSDLNAELISTYKEVKKNPDNVVKHLKSFSNTKEHYYKIRSSNYTDPAKCAAQFIFLNKTSFNGIYRVNRSGIYNVPYGYKKIDFVNEQRILSLSLALKGAEIKCQDFETALEKTQKGDFVFLDPPYTVAHENNGFIAYNQNLFSLDDQIRLSNVLKKLNQKRVNFLMTNAKHDAIKDIYKDVGDLITISRQSVVGGTGARRGLYKEYLLKNF